MDSVGEDCNELKQQYDACFNSWFSERFLKGQTDDSACVPIFRVYQECVKVRLMDFHLYIEFDQLQFLARY